MRLPAGMAQEVWDRLQRLPEAKRVQVYERSAIIQEATGCHWLEADERALAEEAGVATQQRMVGT